MSTPVTMEFADRLQELIAISSKPIKALAREIGVSSGALSKYQNDAAEAGIDALAKISKYFQVSTDWLLGLSDVSSINMDIQGVCKKTGLSEKSADFLITMNKDCTGGGSRKNAQLGALNSFLENWNTVGLLLDMSHIGRMQMNNDRLIEVLLSVLKELESGFDEANPDKIALLKNDISFQLFEMERNERFNRFEAIDLFTRIIDEIYKPTEWDTYFEMCGSGEILKKLAEVARANGEFGFAAFLDDSGI